MADTLFSHDSVFVIRADRVSEAREFLVENAIGALLDDLPSVEQGSIVRYWLPDGEFWWDPAAVECFVGEFCEDGTRVNICESYGDYFIQMKPETTRIVRREEVYDLIDRIDDIDEMDEIGYEDCFFGQGVCLVEWADKIEELLPDNCIRVTIKKDLQKGFDYRSIEIRKA